MSGHVETVADRNLWFVDEDGAPIGSESDATGLIGDAAGGGAEIMVIPAERLDADFWSLETRMAGLFVQKLLNYNWRVVVLGDIDFHLDRSKALRDWVREANRGRTPWFVRDRDQLAAKLREQG